MATQIHAKSDLYKHTLRFEGLGEPGMSTRSLGNYKLFRAVVSSIGGEIEGAYKLLLSRAQRHLDWELDANKESERPIRLEPFLKDDQAVAAYQIASTMLDEPRGISPSKEPRGDGPSDSSVMQEALNMSLSRVSGWAKAVKTKGLCGGLFDAQQAAGEIGDKVKAMRKTRSESSSATVKIMQSAKDGLNTRPEDLFEIRRVSKLSRFIIQIGPLSFVSCGGVTQIVMDYTVKRALTLVDRIKMLIMTSPDMGFRVDATDFLLEFLTEMEDIWEDNPYLLGACLKSARQHCVLKFDKAPITTPDPATLYLRALKAERRHGTKLILKLTKRAFNTKEDRTNFLSLYKGMVTTDVLPSDLVREIYGVTVGARIDENYASRFEGMMRRAAYSSLRAARVTVRSESIQPMSNELSEKLNWSQVPVSTVTKMSTLAWSGIEFKKVRADYRAGNAKVPVSDKSSSMSAQFTRDLGEKLINWAKAPMTTKDRMRDELGTVNDIESFLNGTCKLDLAKSVARFKRVIAAHEKFEAQFPLLGIDDIPSAELAKFVLENPRAAYIVATEPKIGEFHKEVTRTFYMAEQELKVITQAVERLSKQVSRRQTGVSIVKGFFGRRKDLEECCSNVTGDEGDNHNVYISFDMSEFSKLFPQELIRRYGKMLAELTGEDWLERLDVIFRASVVYLYGRGHADYLAGVKGAFEGFLNFVWSSIHATVMEVALEMSGCPGAVLVYSDDGLLRIMVPSSTTNEAILVIIDSIRTTYLRLGLVFHLHKTLVSKWVWEYLGEMCYAGKLLPSWVKELCSLNREPEHRGIRTRQSVIAKLRGKGEAMVKAGMSNITSHYLVTYKAMTELLDVSPNAKPSYLAALTIIPPSCGGFRVASITELGVTTKITSEEEFIADLELLSVTQPYIASKITAEVHKSMRRPKSAISQIIRGSLLSTDYPDVSGTNVINRAIDEARSNSMRGAKLTSSPVTRDALRYLDLIAKSTVGLRPRDWSTIIAATPAWRSYTESVAIMSGNGALKMVNRGVLKSCQAEDTRNCAMAINRWSLVFESEDMARKDPRTLIRTKLLRFYSEYSLASSVPSYRVILVPCSESPTITVKENYVSGLRPIESMYREPRLSFPASGSTLQWFSEAPAGSVETHTRKFLDTAARFIAASPSSLQVVRGIASVFGIGIPYISAQRMSSLNRRSGWSSASVDISVNMPRHYQAQTDIIDSGLYSGFLYTQPRADRTSAQEVARLAGSIIRELSCGSDIVTSDIPVMRHFVIEDRLWPLIHLPTESTALPGMPPPMPCPANPANVTESFRTTIDEYLSLQVMQESFVKMHVLPTTATEADRLMVASLQESHIKEWLHDVYSWKPYGVNTATPLSIPAYARSDVMAKCIIGVCLDTSSAASKANIRRAVSGCIDGTTSRQRTMMRVNRNLTSRDCLTSTEELVERASEVLGILETANVDGLNYPRISELIQPGGGLSSLLWKIVTEASLFRETASPLIVIRSNMSKEGKMSVAHRNVFKQAFSVAIDTLLATRAHAPFADMSFAKGAQFMTDEVLDYLYAFKSLCRESGHRSTAHPYNAASAKIIMYKIRTFIHNMYMDPRGPAYPQPTETDLTLFRLRLRDRAALHEHLKIRTKPDPFETGFDHAGLINGGLPPMLLGRIRHHFRTKVRGTDIPAYALTGPDLQSISRDLSALYSCIIAPAASAMKEYPRSMMGVPPMPGLYNPDLEASMVSFTTSSDKVNGTVIPSAGVGIYENTASLVSELLVTHNKSHQSTGFFIAGSSRSSSTINDALQGKGLLDKSGRELIMMPVRDPLAKKPKKKARGKGSRARARQQPAKEAHVATNLVFVLTLEFEHLDEAAASYKVLTQRPRTTSVIASLSGTNDGPYGVFTITDSFVEVSSARPWNRVTGMEAGELGDLLCIVGIREKSLRISTAAAILTRGAPMRSRTLMSGMIGGLMARVRYEEATLNKISVALQAASDVASDGFGANTSLRSYLLAVKALSDPSNMGTIDDTLKVFKTMYKNESKLGRRAIMSDVTLCQQWLVLHPLTPGNLLRTQDIVDMRNDVSRITSKLTPPLGLSLESPRSASDILSMIRDRDPAELIGNLGLIMCDKLSSDEEEPESESSDSMFTIEAPGTEASSLGLDMRGRRGPPAHTLPRDANRSVGMRHITLTTDYRGYTAPSGFRPLEETAERRIAGSSWGSENEDESYGGEFKHEREHKGEGEEGRGRGSGS
jgi:hypothetical protein